LYAKTTTGCATETETVNRQVLPGNCQRLAAGMSGVGEGVGVGKDEGAFDVAQVRAEP
jgi:hypothetical protein